MSNVIQATTNGTGTVIRADHNGTSGYAGVFQNINAANTTPSLFASTASNGPAFRADTDQGGNAIEGSIFGTGTGSAGNFSISNAANSSPALYATTNGTGNAITAVGKIQATQFIGDGSLLTGISAGLTLPFAGSSATAAASLDITHTGAGNVIQGTSTGSGYAGYFQINNISNIRSAVYATSNAGGPTSYTIHGVATGAASAGYFQTNNATSSTKTLIASTNGVGGAGSFVVSNASSDQPALVATTNGAGAFGTGYAIQGTTTGGASAGYFQINNGTSGAATLYSTSNGTGATVQGVASGTGRAGSFQISNFGSSAAALYSTTGGSGPAVHGVAAAGGYAGYFQISNAASANAALLAETNGTGAAIQANQTNNGIGLDVATGGLHYSYQLISNATLTITTRTVIYDIQTGANTTFTLSPTIAPTNGEICIIRNQGTIAGGNPAMTINPGGVSIPAGGTGGKIMHLVFIGGSWIGL